LKHRHNSINQIRGTSPNARMSVTEMSMATTDGTSVSRNIGSASMASELPMRSVQSRRCWFLTTGRILAAREHGHISEERAD
jgi:hypothetical protein